MKNKTKKIIDAFTEALPEDISAGKLADGINVTFTYEGKEYTVNTRDEQARTRPMAEFYKKIGNRAVEAVLKNNHANN